MEHGFFIIKKLNRQINKKGGCAGQKVHAMEEQDIIFVILN